MRHLATKGEYWLIATLCRLGLHTYNFWKYEVPKEFWDYKSPEKCTQCRACRYCGREVSRVLHDWGRPDRDFQIFCKRCGCKRGKRKSVWRGDYERGSDLFELPELPFDDY